MSSYSRGQENEADTLGLRDRVRFVQANGLAPLKGRAGVVDMIVSNPPYVGEDDPELERAVRRHEPAMALFGGHDGFSVIRPLLNDAAIALAPGGVLLVEIGHRQGQAVRAMAEPLFDSVRIEKDYAGLDRVLVATRAGALPYARLAPPPAPTSEEERFDALPDEGSSTTDHPTTDHNVGDEQTADGVARALLAEAEEVGLPIIDIDSL